MIKKKLVEKQHTGNGIASECIPRWGKNCPDRILIDTKLLVLRKVLNYAVTLEGLLVADIVHVTFTKSACRSFTNGDAQENWVKVINIVNKHDKIKDQNVSDAPSG